MLRRYLVALVGALVGGGFGLAVNYFTGPDYRIIIVSALAVAGFLMAYGERLGLVPHAHELEGPASLFTDGKGRRR
ncbi:MAG TPA: hypothetical protein VKB12_05050 [Pyrinomonadaceae bacterium]|nr:hypothetical protein [Pyrinomonadaceae bacterium]